jgi:ATP-dependent Zn protease
VTAKNNSDEDYNMITRGRLLDRMRVAVAGSLATRLVLGEDTNFAMADIKRVRRMAERFVFYYGACVVVGGCVEGPVQVP